MFQLTFFSLNSKKSQGIFGAKIQTDKCAVAVMDDNPYHLKTFSPNFFMKMTHHFFLKRAKRATYLFTTLNYWTKKISFLKSKCVLEQWTE